MSSFSSELSQESGGSFSFIVDGSLLDSVLQKVSTAIALDSTSSIKETLVLVQNKSLFVIGFTPDVMVEFCIDSARDIKGEGFVGFNLSVLQGLIKKRKELCFTYGTKKDKNVIVFKATKGVYSGEISVSNIDETVLPLLNDKISAFEVKSSIRKSVFSSIVDGLKKTALKNVYNTSQAILSFVDFDGSTGQLDVFSYDQWHMASYRTTVHLKNDDADSFKLSFVPGLFDTFEKLLDKTAQPLKSKDEAIKASELGFGFVNNSLTLVSDSFRVMVPHLQSEDKDFSAPMKLISSLTDPSASFLFGERFLDSIVNLGSLLTVKGSQYELVVDGEKGIYLSVKTSNGIAKDKIPVKNLVMNQDQPIMIRFDPDLLKDLVKPLYKADANQHLFTLSTYDSCYRIDYAPKETNSDGGEDVKYELILICSVYSEDE